MNEFIVRASTFLQTKRKLVIALGLALAVAALPFAVLLYANLRSAIEELLPRNAPSIVALDELHRRLGDNMQLGLYLSGPPSPRLHAFADALAERVQALKANVPRVIDYHPQAIQDFFVPRKALYIDLADLQEVERRLDANIAYARRAANPFDLGLDDEPPAVAEIFDRYRNQQTLLRTYPGGYYDGDDGHSLAMVFYPAAGVVGYHASLAFRDGIGHVAESLKKEMQLHDLKLQFCGDVEAVIQEQLSLQSDLLSSSIIILLLEALLMLGFFRWRASLLALGLPLGIGTVCTLAISYGALGSLNASTAFLGSIIIGNGINPGIMLLARYVEERRQGIAPLVAMSTAVRGTAVPTLIASSAAALAYGALTVTTFRGYTQFGFMGGLGMWLCWIATYIWLPPVAVALDNRHPITTSAPSIALLRIDAWLGRIATFAVRRRRSIYAVAILVTALAVLPIARVSSDPYEPDTTKLRSSWATTPNGYISITRKVDAILKRTLTPVVVLAPSEAAVEPIAERYREHLRRVKDNTLIGAVLTLQSLVPAQQQEKLVIIERLRQRLTPAVVNRLDEPTRALVTEWLPSPSLAPFDATALPEALRRQFREKDGSIGRLVLLFPKHGTNTTDGRIIQRLADEVRSVDLPYEAAIAGSYLIFADMLSSIGHDGPIATVAALIAVVLLSLTLARGARGGLQVTLVLVIGVLWTAGLAAACGMRINFLNFIALPITFGIGVDYATNVYGRYRQSTPGREGIIRAVSHSGAAVAACSATTVIGYSSLLFSRNGALFSFGLLAVLGELACLVAAVVVLPAMLSSRADERFATTTATAATDEP